ncbi:Helix-turn-helix domain-containing protein [Soonwooa buanensis]|uniref:Helix-turn-helix domain-containing protein n=1 Tax=Soonwooa buanensis TaxID=619805 RepID=A0A1T5FDQ2_9FLAO|nr:helix-turn-helix domain-containing protein [Soonwooa buanensis]SKB94293.1 Helix-turn-helix domain-containing protein [Soonwooa buanensis]
MDKTIQIAGLAFSDFFEIISDKIQKTVSAEIERNLIGVTPQRYLSAEQLCTEFSITKPTIHQWRKQGIITAKKLGGRIYYSWQEVEAAMINLDEYGERK